MILIIAVLAILLLIACVGLHVLNEGVKEAHAVAEDYKQRWINETKNSSQMQKKYQGMCDEKEFQFMRVVELNKEILALKTSNQDLHDDIKRLSEQGKEVKETGHLYKTRHHERATPDVYQAVFELTTNGQRVLQSLVAQYSGNAYTSDQNGGERETCRKLGQAEVINFINYQIYKANNPHLFPEQVIEND